MNVLLVQHVSALCVCADFLGVSFFFDIAIRSSPNYWLLILCPVLCTCSQCSLSLFELHYKDIVCKASTKSVPFNYVRFCFFSPSFARQILWTASGNNVVHTAIFQRFSLSMRTTTNVLSRWYERDRLSNAKHTINS